MVKLHRTICSLYYYINEKGAPNDHPITETEKQREMKITKRKLGNNAL
jgi:hypothetical protein